MDSPQEKKTPRIGQSIRGVAFVGSHQCGVWQEPLLVAFNFLDADRQRNIREIHIPAKVKIVKWRRVGEFGTDGPIEIWLSCREGTASCLDVGPVALEHQGSSLSGPIPCDDFSCAARCVKRNIQTNIRRAQPVRVKRRRVVVKGRAIPTAENWLLDRRCMMPKCGGRSSFVWREYSLGLV